MLRIPAVLRLLLFVTGLIALVTIALTVVTNNDDASNDEIARSCSLVRSANAAERPITTDIPMREKIPLEILMAEPKKTEPKKTEKATPAKKATASKQATKSAPKKAASKKRNGKIEEISIFRGREEETDKTPCTPKNDKIDVCVEKTNGKNTCGTFLYPQGSVLYIETLGFCTVHDVPDRNNPKARRRVDWFLPKNPADQTEGENEAERIGHPELMVYVISTPKAKPAKAKATKKHKK